MGGFQPIYPTNHAFPVPNTLINLHRKGGFYSLALGTISQNNKYKPMPGTPPGMKAIRKASRNQKALMPKNSANPPHTPANTRLWRERRKEL
jgi:hypothetical protein